MSRSKMAAMVKNGDVRINWVTCAKVSAEVKEGDLIACAGKGRVRVDSVSLTKKGKYSCELTRMV
jgi:RNA-binding protein YlmH